MAIYSLHHAAIGRSTHRAGTAGAHAEYVTRAAACSLALFQHMPAPRIGARGGALRAWLDAQARAALVRDFAQRLGGGRVPWLAGIHDRGKDEANPHAHLVLRDRDTATGKRVVGMSDKGSTERVRLLWEQAANDALAAAGSAARIDRRSLKAQGVTNRAPQGHEGPAARQIAARGRTSTKLARIEKGRRRAQSAVESRNEARRAQETREARIAAGEAHRAAQDAARAQRERREQERAAERRRAALEAWKARERGRAAQKAEKALSDAQNAAERRERDQAAKIEATVARSRARVLRGRGLANTAVGFLRNVRQGRAMFEPFTQDQLGGATTRLLSCARVLRDAWTAFREGRHPGDFRDEERRFTEASTDLAEMHMVLAPPKRLTGADLAHELDRLRTLEAFPDQDLVRPAMGDAKGRAARIERHIQTPRGRAEMDAHHAREAARAREREQAEERRRQAIQRRSDQEEAEARAERARAKMALPLVQRAAADPEAARILDRWVPHWRHVPLERAACHPDWDRITSDASTRLVRVRRELRALDERPRAPSPPPAPRSEPERDRPTQRPSSQEDPKPKPRRPDPGPGWGGPSM